jgi:hypothetical protein
MNGTDIFGLFTGGLGVLGFLWSFAQWLSPYTRISALKCTIQQLDRLVDEVTNGGGRLHVGVMGEIWECYHRCDPYYLFAGAINLMLALTEFTKSTITCAYTRSSRPPSCIPRSSLLHASHRRSRGSTKTPARYTTTKTYVRKSTRSHPSFIRPIVVRTRHCAPAKCSPTECSGLWRNVSSACCTKEFITCVFINTEMFRNVASVPAP